MSMEINSGNYSQFYKGTTDIQSYGSGSGQKTSMVRYEFNTTDENGNKVMDKMTKEETMCTMNEISAMYDDSVIVSFSGDGLAALAEDAKSQSGNGFHARSIVDGSIVEHDFEAQRKQAELYWERMARLKDNREVHQEYLRLYGTGQGSKAESLFAEFCAKTEGREWKFGSKLSDDGLSLKKEEDEPTGSGYTGVMNSLSDRYRGVDFSIGDGSERLSGQNKYTVSLSKQNADTLKSGEAREKEHIHSLIKDAISAMKDALGSSLNEKLFGQFKFGASIDNRGIPAFFAQKNDGSFTFFSSTMDDLFKLIGGNSK